jgi:hypothetical protein
MTLNDLIDAFAASQRFDRAANGRQQYWRDTLGHRPAVEITPDEVDQALAWEAAKREHSLAKGVKRNSRT